MKVNIIKLSADGMTLGQLIGKLPSLEEGTKFVLKIKKNKRYKLRKFRVTYYRVGHCECCGDYDILSFENTHRHVSLDSHFGGSFLTPMMVL